MGVKWEHGDKMGYGFCPKCNSLESYYLWKPKGYHGSIGLCASCWDKRAESYNRPDMLDRFIVAWDTTKRELIQPMVAALAVVILWYLVVFGIPAFFWR